MSVSQIKLINFDHLPSQNSREKSDPLGDPIDPSESFNIGSSIIEWLEKKTGTKLPETGFLAGQSVVTALLALRGKDPAKQGLVNDLDIFYPSHVLGEEKYIDLHLVGRVIPNPVDKFPVETLKQYTLSRGKEVNVFSCEREGLLNIIHVAGREKAPTLEKIIHYFDLNMVAAGVDLSTREFKADPAFLDYWDGGQVKFHDVPAPQVTFPRVLKKLNEMPWINADVDMLSKQAYTLMSLTKNKHIKGIGFVSRHPKYIQMMDEFDPEKKFVRFEIFERGEMVPHGINLNDFDPAMVSAMKAGVNISQGNTYVGNWTSELANKISLNKPGALKEASYTTEDLNSVLANNEYPLDCAYQACLNYSFWDLLELGATKFHEDPREKFTESNAKAILLAFEECKKGNTSGNIEDSLAYFAAMKETYFFKKLLDSGVSPNSKKQNILEFGFPKVEQGTPVMQIAIKSGATECVHSLIQAGYDLNKSIKGISPAEYAKYEGKPDIEALILSCIGKNIVSNLMDELIPSKVKP